MHSYVHCSAIYNSQDWKQPRCPWSDNRKAVVHLHNVSSTSDLHLLSDPISCHSNRAVMTPQAFGHHVNSGRGFSSL